MAWLIPPEAAVKIWPRVANLIDEAYKFADECMPSDIVDQLARRERQLWIVWAEERVLAAVLTRIVQLRSCRAVQITACGGSASERWAHLISLIEDFARFEGCSKIQIEGRAGWERVFPRFKRVRIVMELELGHGRRRHEDDEHLAIE